jgi:hypothetical protein
MTGSCPILNPITIIYISSISSTSFAINVNAWINLFTREDQEMEADIEDYINAQCRQVVIDRVMDGRQDRTGCEEGEEACDKCRELQQEATIQQHRERFLTGLESAERVEEHAIEDPPLESTQAVTIMDQDHLEFEQQQNERSWIDFHAREINQKEAYEVEELERQLQRFQHRCAWCYVHGKKENTEHRLEDCSMDHASRIRGYCEEFITAVRDKKSMEGYSCCMYCFVPQYICQHWKAKSQDGRWEEDASKECQFKGVIIEGFWSMMFIRGPAGVMEWLKEWSYRDGYDIDDDEGCLRWLGKKVEWGGIEANKLIQAFTFMAKEVEEIEDR